MLLRIVGQDCVCAICLGVAERFREANTLAGGYNLAKDSCSKNVVKVIQESNAFRMEGGQREKFKFCAEKGFRKNYLEGGGNEERKEDQRGKIVARKREVSRFNREARKERECWHCGAKGHFRFERPTDE